MKKNALLVGSLAVVSALLSGCSNEKPGVDLSPNAVRAAAASGIDMSKGPVGGELHIYTWSDYIAPDVKAGFEKALGCKVVIDTFDSNEAMYAKLKAGGSGYDIITPTSYLIGTMAKEKMIVPLDHSKVPNLKDFDRRFASQIIDPTFRYSIPYSVTYGGFLYSKGKIPEGADVESWSILANPALKGRITMLDDIRETLGGALMSLGYSINSTNKDEIAAATERLMQWRPNIRKFDAESYKTEVPAGSSFLAHGYSTDSIQVIVGDEDEGLEARPDIGFALPKEGFSIAFDEMVLSSGAPRPDLAYAFMNYIYDGDVAKVNMEFICGPVPVKSGIDLLDEEYIKLVVLDDERMKLGQVIRGFEDNPAAHDLYNKAWDRVKATEER